MELDTFITKTINSIVKGVAESRYFAKENGALVNPKMVSLRDNSDRTTITNLEFDIAITSSMEKENGINGGISVFNVSVGGIDFQFPHPLLVLISNIDVDKLNLCLRHDTHLR